ncbi:hypothetical protein [Limnochorda pilosa]|uniref:Transposase n=1 Tax=Limnochorda pilosa TaxID=1555112 RepID=A0A0K2SNI4_LIMPI|nr:hypothetical protein [Limnochorda pilosa]BAS28577.1 hypothetical protein LIP_2747 [Limnochorda pilosa]
MTTLKERFHIERAIFVGDAGMYSETAIESIEENGFGSILGVEWHGHRSQLEKLAPWQFDLLDQRGVAERIDEEEGVRYALVPAFSRQGMAETISLALRQGFRAEARKPRRDGTHWSEETRTPHHRGRHTAPGGLTSQQSLLTGMAVHEGEPSTGRDRRE